MGALAKSEMAVGLTSDIQPIRRHELGGVAVGRANGKSDEAAAWQLTPANRHGRRGHAVVQLQRALKAQQLFHRRAEQSWIGHQALELFALAEQGVHAVAYQVGGGLMPGIEQEDAVVQQLGLRQAFAIYFALQQARQHIAVWVARLLPPLGHQDTQMRQEGRHRRIAAY